MKVYLVVYYLTRIPIKIFKDRKEAEKYCTAFDSPYDIEDWWVE